MELRVKTLIFWAFTEKSNFYGGVHKKPIWRGDCLRRGGGGGLGQFGDLRRGLGKKEGDCVFEGGGGGGG